MDIKRIFYAVARKWWLIVLLAVIGGGIGFLNVYNTKPVYQADTKLYIMNLDKVLTERQALKSSDITLSQQLVRQYYEIIYSRSVISAVSQEIKEYNLSENEILSMVSISSKPDSNIFTISARGTNPMITAAVANATGRAFSAKISQLSNSENVGILDEALTPNYPVNNKGTQKIILGILSGLMVAFGIIYIIEYFDTTVRSVEDIENGLNISVIGVIPELNIR